MYTMSEVIDGACVAKKQLPRDVRITELGSVLYTARRQKKWTLRTAAQKVGIEHSGLSEIERGLRRPDFETLVGFHSAYDIPLEEVVRMAARDAKIPLPADPIPYRDLAARLAARSVVFPDLAKILDRLADSDPAAYRSFLLMLDLWDHQDDELR